MKLRLLPRGHATFDVHDGFVHLGSVWRTRGGWVAYRRSLSMLSGKSWPTPEDAAVELAAKTAPNRDDVASSARAAARKVARSFH